MPEELKFASDARLALTQTELAIALAARAAADAAIRPRVAAAT